MTGRDLMVYILENHLEDSEVVKNGIPIGLMSTSEFAVKMNVGEGTVKAWLIEDHVKHYDLKGGIYIPKNFEAFE